MDSTRFNPVMDKLRLPRRRRGRPRRTPAGIGADETHSTRATRVDLGRRGHDHLGTVSSAVF
ncbi:hypothetical protein [Streptomyces enissocaesilis]|uniref:hypothetical protein n=1 Tax=Streptomyces enissocaesilis TaxID=332589 RepID=UPI0031D19BA5